MSTKPYSVRSAERIDDIDDCRDGFAIGRDRNFERVVCPKNRWYFSCKAAGDFLVALVLFVILLPVILLAALLVKLTSRGPAFYCQTRLGKQSRVFRLYKLRTMVHNAESATGPVWTKTNDPRITPLGQLLRDTHIDEFPQIVNVLLGHMSLVGPRPERPEFVATLEWQLPNYRDRLNVRPGITGIAQLSLPPDSDLESVQRKLVHDLYYICYAGPWLDLRILVYTAWLFLKTLCVAVRKLVDLPSAERVNSRVEGIIGTESELLVNKSD